MMARFFIEGRNVEKFQLTLSTICLLIIAFVSSHRQWPVAFPELVDALVSDTKLEKDQVGAWTSTKKC